MQRLFASFLVLALAGCSAAVSDLGNYNNSADACDPRGTQHLGDDITIQFQNTNAHINQDMRFAFEVGTGRNIEALAVISAFNNPNQLVHLPEMMPADPTTLAFWADSNGNPGFDQLNPPDGSLLDGGLPPAPDHQWFRPVCPDGHVTFTHTTPFQDISMATSTGAIFRFHVPTTFRNQALFSNYAMAVWAVRVFDDGGRQTRAYYQYHPFVPLGGMTPTQRNPVDTDPDPMIDNGFHIFQVGGNVLGEARGAIDTGEMYEIHFVIDANRNGRFGASDGDSGDYSCSWPDQMAPPGSSWEFDPTMPTSLIDLCDDGGFDPTNPPVP